MVKLRRGTSFARPSSALGLMSFSDTGKKAPQLTPEIVIVITLLFAIAILLLRTFSA